jgi:DNA invertase Pin-like site-specific DNA recombinase
MCRAGVDHLPSGRATFQMCGVFAQFRDEMIHERVNVGARPVGRHQVGSQAGVAKVLEENADAIRARRAGGKSIRTLVRRLQLSTTAVREMPGPDSV